MNLLAFSNFIRDFISLIFDAKRSIKYFKFNPHAFIIATPFSAFEKSKLELTMTAQQELMPYAFFGGKIIPFEDARISIANQSLQYGLTCFGGIRGYHVGGKNKIFRLYDHYLRLQDGLKLLGIQADFVWPEFQQLIRELVLRNAPSTDFYIRPFFHSTSTSLGPRFIGVPFQLSIYMTPLGNYFGHPHGLKLQISSWRKFSDAALPTKAKAGGCYLNAALAKSEAIMNGYDDALLMDASGYIVEGSVANLFLSHKGRLLTPETGSAILEGITRRTVIELLALESIEVHTCNIDRSMVYTAEEVFLSGTAAQLAFVQSIDGRTIGTGAQAGFFHNLLQSTLKSVVEGLHTYSSQWITEY